MLFILPQRSVGDWLTPYWFPNVDITPTVARRMMTVAWPGQEIAITAFVADSAIILLLLMEMCGLQWRFQNDIAGESYSGATKGILFFLFSVTLTQVQAILKKTKITVHKHIHDCILIKGWPPAFCSLSYRDLDLDSMILIHELDLHFRNRCLHEC